MHFARVFVSKEARIALLALGGGVLQAQGDLDGARAMFQESLAMEYALLGREYR